MCFYVVNCNKLYKSTVFFSISRLLKNVATCILIIIVTYVNSSESLLCDTCTCSNSIVNCTDNGLIDILDLWDHSEVLKDATLMYFDYNNIVHVKQFPLSKVRYLSLRHNKLNKIEDNTFTNLKYLVELDLSHNLLTTESLNPNIFKVGTTNLFRFY